MEKLSVILKRIFSVIAVLGILSFTIINNYTIELETNDVPQVVISEWFPHEFNLNPTNYSSFKISYDSNKTLNDHTILVFGRNLLGTKALPHNNSKQEYTFQLSEHHIEFEAKNINNGNKVPFDFFTEFSYMIIPNTEIASMTATLDYMDYGKIAEYFDINE